MVTSVNEHRDTGPLPAGEFSAWLRQMRAALAGAVDSDVPCGDCCACCSTSHFVHVDPDERQTLAVLPRELTFPAPGAPAGHLVLPYDSRGRCPLLDERGRCAVYDGRPRTCRVYDCRVYAAAGIPADREPISRRAARWAFTYADEAARAEHEAVRAAARFVRENPALFPGGNVPADPAQVAVIAVKAAGLFVAGGGEAGDPALAASGAETARAVVEAVERFVPAPRSRGESSRVGERADAPKEPAGRPRKPHG